MGAKKIVSFPFQETVQNNSENIKDLKTQIQNCNENIYKLEIRLSQKIEKNSQNIITRLENTIKEGKTQLEQRIDDKSNWLNDLRKENQKRIDDQNFWLKSSAGVCAFILIGLFTLMLLFKSENKKLISDNKILIRSTEKTVKENKNQLIYLSRQIEPMTEAKNINNLQNIKGVSRTISPQKIIKKVTDNKKQQKSK